MTEAINERDKELLAKCVNIIKENFENPAFDVTALASELCVGRSKLYMQFKQMTGLTPNEFILKIKLDVAMYLLKNHPASWHPDRLESAFWFIVLMKVKSRLCMLHATETVTGWLMHCLMY